MNTYNYLLELHYRCEGTGIQTGHNQNNIDSSLNFGTI